MGAPRTAVLGLLALLAGCGDGQEGEAPQARQTPPMLPEARAKARRVEAWMANYGGWDETKIDLARRHALVVVHPMQADLTREVVAAIQRGIDQSDALDDVLVLGYISVGEDLRTRHLTDEQISVDPRFRGNAAGPRVDPRGPNADGTSLEGVDPLGAPSPGGTGYASWFLDDNDVDRIGTGDGKPDRNRTFGGAFVNAGDPAWFDVLQGMSIDGPDGVPGLREILTRSYGRGLGCDGLFLDTIDTCAPNSFTSPASDNPSEFEWTAPGYSAFLARLRQAYPQAVLLQNRGLFFFDPRHPHFRFTTRGSIDLALFESFRLNSNRWEEYSPYFYPDNRYNVAPKLMAEANRPDGFRVLSLGYAEGPSIAYETLTGGSTSGLETLLEDVRVAHAQGFRHYITDGGLGVLNTFVRDHAEFTDTSPPQWSSTFNENNPGYPAPTGPPTARVGVQEVVAGPGRVTVRWDVALDLHPVRYRLYYQDLPFDFADLRSAARVNLNPRVGVGYGHGWGVGPRLYPYEATVDGLRSGATYHFLIRAVDGSAAANEDANQVVLTAQPM